MAISDKRIVEMIKEFEADHRTWPALKAALFARGNKPIPLPKEMYDRMQAAKQQSPERFARARSSLNN